MFGQHCTLSLLGALFLSSFTHGHFDSSEEHGSLSVRTPDAPRHLGSSEEHQERILINTNPNGRSNDDNSDELNAIANPNGFGSRSLSKTIICLIRAAFIGGSCPTFRSCCDQTCGGTADLQLTTCGLQQTWFGTYITGYCSCQSGGELGPPAVTTHSPWEEDTTYRPWITEAPPIRPPWNPGGGLPRECGGRPNSRHRRSIVDSSEETPGPPRARDADDEEPFRIHAGNTSQIAWPWQVSLQMGGQHFCGGSLITTRHIVTAAHCFKYATRPSMVKVELGTKTLGQGTKMDVESITLHPQYGGEDRLNNDIAILRLVAPVRFTSSLGPICLAEADAPTGKRCAITGWGRTSNVGEPPKQLMEAQVSIVSQNECSQSWRSMLDESMVCARDRRMDTCRGDSGGPLVSQRADGKWELQGVVSFGLPGCGDTSKPSVYARVSHLRSWVIRNIG